MIRTFALAGLIAAFLAPGGFAWRSQEPSQNPSTNQNSLAPGSVAPGASPAKPKTKKVWTNDNVPDSGDGISVVGTARKNAGAKAQPKAAATQDSVDPRLLATLRDQLHRLQAQLAVVERQYSDLKAQSKGESKNAGGLQQNTSVYDSSSVQEQLQHLQEKKNRLEATIDELMDAARKAGIEPGNLR